MEVDIPGLSEETSVKKQRMDISSGARLDFELPQHAAVPVMSSPVTAFSRLNFNHLSPLCECPSPTITDDRRTTNLKTESWLSAASSSSTSSASGVVIRLGSKHSHGLKRPLSGPPSDTQLTQSLDCGAAKRPLARPRSITLPSTIQPLQEISVPTNTDVVQPSRTEHNCLYATVAADSEEHAKIIPLTSALDCPPQSTVDQCPVNSTQ